MDIEVIEDIKDVVPLSTDDRLLQLASEKGNIEVLERLIALRRSEEERRARIVFEQHFAIMQSKLPVISKHKDNRGTDSKYAPLEDIQREWDPVIRSEGFSYSWREEMVDGFDGKRILLDITGFGHTKTNYFDSPRIEGNKAQNAIQVAGSMSTYGRRYTFVGGFGGRVEGEDSDGQIPTDLEVLKLDLEGYMAERGQDGKLKLTTEACAIIKAELDKEEPDIKRLQAFHKKAGAKCRGIK